MGGMQPDHVGSGHHPWCSGRRKGYSKTSTEAPKVEAAEIEAGEAPFRKNNL